MFLKPNKMPINLKKKKKIRLNKYVNLKFYAMHAYDLSTDTD